MTHPDKLKKLKDFENEKDFREFLISLLKKMGFKDVLHTHRYGFPEFGKDIIGKIEHPIEGEEWYSFVVKKGRISGNTDDVENIKNQISQSLEYPYNSINGNSVKISKVKVVTNENFTNGAQNAISSSPQLKSWNGYSFWWNEPLVDLIDKNYPDFWLPGDEFIKSYSKELKRSINEEFELKELSLQKIDDKNVQKLINIFVEPNMTEVNIEQDKDKLKGKSYNRKKVGVNTVFDSSENFIIVGEAGSGKSKILNNLVCDILDSTELVERKNIPVKLKAKEIRANKFDILKSIEANISLLIEDGLPNDFTEYTFQLFIDEIDLLFKEERESLFNNLTEFCKNGHRFVITKRRNYNLEVEETKLKARTLRVHNFNINQVKNFIAKFFDADKGSKFISILTESNILQKLPTTPLTITLLSLLYDGNSYEIPATLTDIYDDFSNVLLGKLEVKSKFDLLAYNIKKRLFTIVALEMLINKRVDLEFKEFEEKVNSFLSSRGYVPQTRDELIAIVENSGILYIDENERVGFKQQAFIEYMASVEIYDHSREEHYESLLTNFNDISWQNTAIFFAGKSKDLPKMIPDLISKMPNNNANDWFINTGGMGYLSQALYQTEPKERKKLVLKALDNLCLSFNFLKGDSKNSNGILRDAPLPILATILNFWFVENFRSITLKQTLIEAYDDLALEYKDVGVNDFFGDFKLFMIASALMNKNIGSEEKFTELTERDSFIKNPVLMIAGDMYLENGDLYQTSVNNQKLKFEKVIKQYIEVVKYIVKEPAFKINNDYRLLSASEIKVHEKDENE
ncbi:NACHT domain-containing protein [Pedobacter helvus]|uniref:NACHT domain-containing protein n=1 Tax=Pedobacter helvus TaxID=2563444 RepID=A0ABW9JGQ1_9SPHI|nr:restriction endonuclease [Pedobacter ureilyticus]